MKASHTKIKITISSHKLSTTDDKSSGGHLRHLTDGRPWSTVSTSVIEIIVVTLASYYLQPGLTPWGNLMLAITFQFCGR